MKINTLRLGNFQGIKSAGFDFNGQSASIYGDNATGKTTVYNAVTWLLFDRPSTGAKNFTPKTRNQHGGDVHYLDHSAEAVFSMEDGRLITLRKVFHENYKKKRGAAAEEFSGHSVDFYIDGVPVKEKEYTSSLLAFCGGPEQMKILTMPHYFAEDMTWEARRKILLEVCGDISDADVIASAAGLEELNDFLLMPGTDNQYYTVDEYKKIASAKKADINKRLQDIPGRIDEAQRAIPERAFSLTELDAALKELESQRDQLTERKASVLAGDTATSDARKRTAEAEAALMEARMSYLSRTSTANQSTQEAIAETQKKLFAAQEEHAAAEGEADRLRRNAERMELCRKELLEQYAAIQAETWDEGEAVCPTCHRELPPEEVQRIRDAFHLKKSERLQEINARGQKEANKEVISRLRAQSEACQLKAAETEAACRQYRQELDILKSQLQTPAPFETTEEYTQLFDAVVIARNSEKQEGKNIGAALGEIEEQLRRVREEICEKQMQKGQAEQIQAQKRRISELKAQEKELSAQYEELEKGIYLCDQFTKAKVRMLTSRINGKFRGVQFRLFLEQVNGGVKDDCEVLVPNDAGTLVPFRDANNAARINAGLEIIEALSKHWGISMPVFIDNAESVTHLLDTTMQTVRLVVSEPDKKLRLVPDIS